MPDGSRGNGGNNNNNTNNTNGGGSGSGVRRRERLMATTEITDAAIRATATATATAMAFRPIEGARPPEGPGWGRAFYEPSPFDVTPGPARRPVVHVGQQEAAMITVGPPAPAMGRRRAETMPGGMAPVVESAAPPQPQPSESASSAPPVGRLFFDHRHHLDGNGVGEPARVVVDLATVAGPSRVVRNEEEEEDAVFGFSTGDEIAMDLD